MIDEKVIVLLFYLLFGLFYFAVKFTFKALFVIVRFLLKMIIQKKKMII